MTLGEWILQLLNRGQQKQAAPQVIGHSGETPDGFQPVSSLISMHGLTEQREFAKLFKSTAFACIQKRAKAISQMELEFKRQTGPTTFKPLPYDHWLPRLFRRPTVMTHITTKMIFEWLEIWHCGRGASHLFFPLAPDRMSRNLVPSGMYPLPADMVFPKLGSQSFIEYFRFYGASGKPVDYPANQVAFMLAPGASSDVIDMYTSGAALIDAAYDDITADEAIKQFLRNQLTDAMLPPWFIKAPNSNKEQRDTVRKQLREKTAKGNSEPVAFIEPSWEIVSLDTLKPATSAQSLSLPYQKAICAAIDTPVGFFDSELMKDRATLDTIVYMWMTQTIEPRMQDITNVLTQFAQQWEADVVIDFKRIDRRDTAAERQEHTFLLGNGLQTPNQIAKARNLPPIPTDEGGDTYYVPRLWVAANRAMLGEANTPTPGGADAATPEDTGDKAGDSAGDNSGNADGKAKPAANGKANGKSKAKTATE